MKILTTTFFKDFARYFNYLEDSLLNEDKNIEFFNISIYPCANYYWLKKGKHSILLPEIVSRMTIRNINEILDKDNYKNINLDEIIHFNYKSQLMYSFDNKNKLKIQAIKYIEYFDKLFSNTDFDIFISSGDSRMLIEISVLFAKRYGVKVFYFEQGPFGTTMIDEKGVNCNISFMDIKSLPTNIDKDKLSNFINNYKNNKKEKYWKYEKKTFFDKFYDLKTFYWMYPCKIFTSLVPCDVQMGSSLIQNLLPIIKKKLINNKNTIINEQIPDNAITFIMQVPVDAQLIDNSPLYKDFYTMLVDIHISIPKDYALVIREHPNYLGKYDEEIYKYISNHKNIQILNNISLHDTIENSELIILNNSTVGIEALTYYKTVLTLGNAYYNRKDITYNLTPKDNLSELIKDALSSPIKESDIDVFLYNFIFDYLFDGHFQDYELANASNIIYKIKNVK
jgi:capsular polysaccharide export protein